MKSAPKQGANFSPHVVWGLAVLGLVLGSVQVFGNLARAAAAEDWARFDRLLGWLWITIAVVIGLSVLILLALNFVMLPFWRLRKILRRRFPGVPTHLSYESAQLSGEPSDAPRGAIGSFSVVITASSTGMQLWRGRDPRVVLDIPAGRIHDVGFELVGWRRPTMRVTLEEPEGALQFFLADEVALGIFGPSPRKVEQIVESIGSALSRSSEAS